MGFPFCIPRLVSIIVGGVEWNSGPQLTFFLVNERGRPTQYGESSLVKHPAELL